MSLAMMKPCVREILIVLLVCVAAVVVLTSLGLISPATIPDITWRPSPESRNEARIDASSESEVSRFETHVRATNNASQDALRTTSEPSKTPSPDFKTTPFRGYLLPVNIEQQVTAALDGYGDQEILASLLNLSSVEPYVHSSNLVGVPTVGTKVIKLSALYDFAMFRTKIRSCSKNNDHETSTFETFLETASREVVLVFVLISQGQYKSKFAGSKSRIVEIDANGKGTKQALTRLNKWAAYVSKENGTETATFRVRRVFVMDARPKKALHLPEIVDVLGSAIRQQISKSGSVTMLFDNWRAVHSIPNSAYFNFIPEFRRICTSIHEVAHSQTVINASRAFAQGLSDTDNEAIIGVHIRAERLLQKYKRNFVKCLKALDNLLHNVRSKASSSQVRVIHDFSKYGTNSCYGDCSRYHSKFLSELKKLNYRVVYFDPNKFPSFPHNSAFASFVEREYLSGMDVLVTLGHGGFQNSIVERFLKRSSKNEENLHRICSEWI